MWNPPMNFSYPKHAILVPLQLALSVKVRKAIFPLPAQTNHFAPLVRTSHFGRGQPPRRDIINHLIFIKFKLSSGGTKHASKQLPHPGVNHRYFPFSLLCCRSVLTMYYVAQYAARASFYLFSSHNKKLSWSPMSPLCEINGGGVRHRDGSADQEWGAGSFDCSLSSFFVSQGLSYLSCSSEFCRCPSPVCYYCIVGLQKALYYGTQESGSETALPKGPPPPPRLGRNLTFFVIKIWASLPTREVFNPESWDTQEGVFFCFTLIRFQVSFLFRSLKVAAWMIDPCFPTVVAPSQTMVGRMSLAL